MHTKTVLSFLFVSTVALSSACSSEDADNEAACKEYVAALECGDFDVTSLYPANFCGQYSSLSCDISEYFDCLTENTKCVKADPDRGDYLDQSGISACLSKARCD